MNHWNVLSTLEDMYGLAHIGSSIGRPAITDVWAVPEPGTAGLLGAGLAAIETVKVDDKDIPVAEATNAQIVAAIEAARK